jgi:hypothetical protein
MKVRNTVNIKRNIFFLHVLFTSHSLLTTADIDASIIANYSPPLVSLAVLQDAANTLLELYPDIPALGSPFNTGNETFGLPTGYKREAAIVEFGFSHLHFLLTKFFEIRWAI